MTGQAKSELESKVEDVSSAVVIEQQVLCELTHDSWWPFVLCCVVVTRPAG